MCGAAVIGADAASLPEVIGSEEALFDPFDVDAIAACLSRVVEDPDFVNRLKANGVQRAQAFSWDHTAKCALTAWQAQPWTTQPIASPRLSVRSAVEASEGEESQHEKPAVASADDVVSEVIAHLSMHRYLPEADEQLRELARALDFNHPLGEENAAENG